MPTKSGYSGGRTGGAAAGIVGPGRRNESTEKSLSDIRTDIRMLEESKGVVDQYAQNALGATGATSRTKSMISSQIDRYNELLSQIQASRKKLGANPAWAGSKYKSFARQQMTRLDTLESETIAMRDRLVNRLWEIQRR